jgi:hypothetical protein
MTKKKRKRRPASHRQPRHRTTPRRPPGRPILVTPEGDLVVFCSAQYRHAAMEEIWQILRPEADFDLDDDLEPGPDGALQFEWYETEPGMPPPSDPLERRILATLTLTPATLEVETMSEQRLDRFRRRLEGLLGDRVYLAHTRTQSVEQALAEGPPEDAPEPLVLPPEAIAELEERMLRRWIDESIPALGGMTPREAVRTPEGRQMVMDLLDYIERQQARYPPSPRGFSPDYRKVIKMLGLE